MIYSRLPNSFQIILKIVRKGKEIMCNCQDQDQDQDPVITLCAELEEQHPGFGFGRAAKEILEERKGT